MSSRHLRIFFTETPSSVFNAWYKERLAMINKALRRAYEKSNRSNPTLILPDAALEVFGETIARIGVDWNGYEWTGKGDFNFFFDACSAKTVHYVHSRTRPDRQRLVPMSMEDLLIAASDQPIEPTQIQDTSRSLYQRTLATMMASSHLQQGGAVEKYLTNLDQFVQDQSSPDEICTKIGISTKSLGSTRARARRAWGDPEKE